MQISIIIEKFKIKIPIHRWQLLDKYSWIRNLIKALICLQFGIYIFIWSSRQVPKRYLENKNVGHKNPETISTLTFLIEL